MSEVKPLFHGEVQLAGWSESHNGGCKVTFWLQDSSDLDAFRAMTVRKGNTAGQRLACALVEIGEDEQPVPPQESAPEPKTAPERKGGLLSQWVAMRGNEGDFAEFLAWKYQGAWKSTFGAPVPQRCATVVRTICAIESRAELDRDEEAAKRFHERIRGPYSKFMTGREVPV